MRISILRSVTAVSCLSVAAWIAHSALADPPAAPKVSSFAPADDLVKQVQVFLESFEGALATEQGYAEKKDTLTRDAHTLAAVALALGLHDNDHPYKKPAPGVAKAAQQLAKAKDYAAAKTAFEQVKAAAEGKAADGVELTWNQKIGSMGQLMKQVTYVNNRLRLGARRPDRAPEENLRNAALLAVLAQAVTFDTHEVKDPEKYGKWYELCAQMRDASAAVGAALRAKDQPATQAAIMRLSQSCDTCHKEFRVEAKP